MKNDEKFTQKATECRDAQAWMVLAKEACFDISVDDITIKDFQEALAEMSDDELDGVAGGMVNQVPRNISWW